MVEELAMDELQKVNGGSLIGALFVATVGSFALTWLAYGCGMAGVYLGR